MADKKLFLGVTEQDVQKQERGKQEAAKVAEAKHMALEKAKRAVEEKAAQKKSRKKLHDLYNNVLPLKVKIGIIAALNFCIGGLYRASKDYSEAMDIMTVPLGHALVETYIPTYSYQYNWDWNGSNKDPRGKGEFGSFINGRWVAHMLVLLTEALVLAFIAMNNVKKNKQIDLMAEIAELSKEQNIDQKYITAMLKVAPSIVQNMSKDSRVYFDMLMEGRFDIEKTPGILNIATGIMQGHLQSHPEDLHLVLDMFDERSIPSEIKAKAVTKER